MNIRKFTDELIKEKHTSPSIVDEYYNDVESLDTNYRDSFVSSISLLLDKWRENNGDENQFILKGHIELYIGTIVKLVYNEDKWFVDGFYDDTGVRFEVSVIELEMIDLHELLDSLSNIKELSNNLNTVILRKLNN